MRKKKVMPPPRREPEPVACSLCDRPFVRSQLTRHHCKPRQKGGGVEDIALLCPQCHGMVHATFTNATLARLYATIDELRQAPELAKFLGWVKKQPPSRRKRNVSRRMKI
jgi:5-methylcytosine-specific restriction protein A